MAYTFYQKTPGSITCKPNCATTLFVPVLRALRRFGLLHVTVTTEQALSGKGDGISDPLYVENAQGRWQDWPAQPGQLYNTEEWKALTRSAVDYSPDGTRRPLWLKRPLKPAKEAYQLPEIPFGK